MLDWFAERWNELLNVFMSLMLTAYDMLSDLFSYLFESITLIVLGLINGLEFSFSKITPAQYLSALPEEVLSFMVFLGINEISVIIVSALTVRFVLQLIPFVRLGS